MIVECDICHKYSDFNDLIEDTTETDEEGDAVLCCPYCTGSFITILWEDK